MVTIAFDPGNTTGIAIIGASGELLYDTQMSHDEFVEYLVHPPTEHRQAFRAIDLVVVEDFQLLPSKARQVSQTKSRGVHAARGIGAAQLFAAMRGVELVYRRPESWRIGLQLAGIEQSKWPKKHADGHSLCAYGAGYHALVELDLVKSQMPAL